MTQKIKLAGQMYLKPDTGEVFLLHGGWFEYKLGNIKGTKAFDEVLRTHGKKEGKGIRLRLAQAINKNITFGKP